MLRNDFAPLLDEIPDYVKTTYGTVNSGSKLVQWLYDEFDFYPDKKEAKEEAVEAQDLGPGDKGKAKDETTRVEPEGHQEVNESRFQMAGPREEYQRQVERYNEWIIYKEELPHVRFPWEKDEEPSSEEDGKNEEGTAYDADDTDDTDDADDNDKYAAV